MTLEVTVLFALVFLAVILVAVLVIRFDSKAHKKYIALRRAQEEQWQVTDQFHQAVAGILHETARHSSDDDTRHRREDRSRSRNNWRD
jgi:hypothetical protein